MVDRTIALVTGANKGLGYETARRLRKHSHKVYLAVRNAERGLTAAAELGVTFVQLDVTHEASVAGAAAELDRLEGRLDVLVNNAGIREPRLPVDDAGIPQPFKEAADLTGSDASQVFETNGADGPTGTFVERGGTVAW